MAPRASRALRIAVVLVGAAALLVIGDRALFHRALAREQERQAGFRPVWRPGGVAFLGDSHVENWNLAAAFPGRPVANLGVSGETSLGVSRRLPDALALRPAVVVVQAGANDLEGVALRGEAAGPIVRRLVQNLDSIAAGARASRVEPVLTTIPPVGDRYLLAHLELLPLPTAGLARRAAAIRRANTAIRGLGWQRGARVVDLHEALADDAGQLGRRDSLPDGIHLSPDGYAKLRRVLARELPQL